MTSGVVCQKSRRGRKLQCSDVHYKFLTEFRRRAANFHQRRLWVLKHRRNNHGDQGRQVPPTFGCGGTSNALVPCNFLVITFSICMKSVSNLQVIVMRQCNRPIFDTLVIFRIEFHASTVLSNPANQWLPWSLL